MTTFIGTPIARKNDAARIAICAETTAQPMLRGKSLERLPTNFGTRGNAARPPVARIVELPSIDQPADAVRILEALAQRYASDSLNRTHTEFAVRVMRFVVERGEVGAFEDYLNVTGKQ